MKASLIVKNKMNNNKKIRKRSIDKGSIVLKTKKKARIRVKQIKIKRRVQNKKKRMN